MDFKELQYQKAYVPIEVAFGKEAVVRELHEQKAYDPIEVAFGKEAVVRE